MLLVPFLGWLELREGKKQSKHRFFFVSAVSCTSQIFRGPRLSLAPADLFLLSAHVFRNMQIRSACLDNMRGV